MIRYCIQEHRNGVVLHFQHQEVLKEDTACDFLDHRNGYKDVLPHEACLRRTLKLLIRIVAVQSTKAQILHHQVRWISAQIRSKKFKKKNLIFAEKGSLLSRLFRRSGRNKARQLETYSGQFPPAEWFNSKAVHLHSVGTQTQDHVSIIVPTYFISL